MVVYYNINNDICNLENIDYDLDWLVMYHLCKPVNNN